MEYIVVATIILSEKPLGCNSIIRFLELQVKTVRISGRTSKTMVILLINERITYISHLILFDSLQS